jgi:uncharacterized membrane protein
MAFCPNCGTQASGAFCPNCGMSMSGAAAPGAGAGAGGFQSPPSAAAAGGLSENTASALCYLFGLVTGIVFLVIAPYNQNKTVRFHAFQSIFAHVALIIIAICLGIFGMIMTVLTHGLGFFLFPLFWLAGFILWLYMMYTAYNNKKVKLPFIGDLAEKQA